MRCRQKMWISDNIAHFARHVDQDHAHRAREFDIAALLDTGIQAAVALRQTWGRAVPTLVITGDMAPERLQMLRDCGFPWLPKPVMPMRLRSWLAAQQGAVELDSGATEPN